MKTVLWHRLLPRTQRTAAMYVLFFLAVLGFAVRVAVALLSSGSSDINFWYTFASLGRRFGVPYLYAHVPAFNHPPLMGYWAIALLRISDASGIRFPLVFRLPVILADLGSALLLWDIWRPVRPRIVAALAVTAFSWSLVAILMSGFHGNTDSLAACLCLLAAYCCERKRPFAGGLTLAGALNVKLIPILLVPAFALRQRSWRAFLEFGIGAAVGVLPFLPVLTCCGRSFYAHAIAYNSNVDNWGIILFLQFSRDNPALRQLAAAIETAYVPNGRFLIAGLILLVSLWARIHERWSYYELGAICFAIFLIFTPGFGVQYTAYICPLLFAVSLRWGTAYSALAGLFLAVVYYSFWDGTVPFRATFTADFPMPAPLFGLLAWALLIQFVLWCLRRTLAPQNALRNTSPVRK